jgi:hypothetical protein
MYTFGERGGGVERGRKWSGGRDVLWQLRRVRWVTNTLTKDPSSNLDTDIFHSSANPHAWRRSEVHCSQAPWASGLIFLLNINRKVSCSARRVLAVPRRCMFTAAKTTSVWRQAVCLKQVSGMHRVKAELDQARQKAVDLVRERLHLEQCVRCGTAHFYSYLHYCYSLPFTLTSIVLEEF